MNAGETRSPEQMRFGLQTVAAQIKRWLEWDRNHRRAQNLTTDGNTHIMSLPVPSWPSHAQFEAWIKLFEECAATLPAAPPATTSTLTELHQRAIDAVAEFEDAASYEETMWTGWGDCIVPPMAEMRRIKAQQALAALRDAQPNKKPGN